MQWITINRGHNIRKERGTGIQILSIIIYIYKQNNYVMPIFIFLIVKIFTISGSSSCSMIIHCLINLLNMAEDSLTESYHKMHNL
jgi:hypothetical protein